MSETGSTTKKSDNKKSLSLDRRKLVVTIVLAGTALLIILSGVYWFFLKDAGNGSDNSGLTKEEIEFNRRVEEADHGPSQEEIKNNTPDYEQAVAESIGSDEEAQKRYELAYQYILVAEYDKAETENNKALSLAKEQNDEELIALIEIQKENIDYYQELIERDGQ